jgi:hypothetical protein
MRSAQLLTVAAISEFPIVLETMRECLTDVFDLEALHALQRQIASRSIQIVEVETTEPSPFAKSLLFGYVGAFVYEGDVPLAERRPRHCLSTLPAGRATRQGRAEAAARRSVIASRRPTCRVSAPSAAPPDRNSFRPAAHGRSLHRG